jgi:uncharacterized repeat protein (TIGR01451 family)
MRNVTKILASGIVAASAGLLALAGDDAFVAPPAPPAPPAEPSATAAPAGPSSGVSLTDPISTAPKSPAFNPFASEPVPATALPAPQQSSHSPAIQAQASSHDVGHAPAAASGQSESHHASPSPGPSLSPFDEPAFGGASASQAAPAPAAASSLSPPPTTAGGLDAAQAPAVSVRWVKKSPIVVGQECQCDLVVKNTGKTPARDLLVDAYFPATVRLTHAEPMPADNQDHVTWTFAALGGSEERVIHIKLVPSRRGELATTAAVRFSSAASNTFSVEEPLLALALRGPKELMVGDPATQTITVHNPGTGVAHNVAIEAHLSKGLEAARGEQLVIQVGSLSPGESRVVRLPLIAVVGGEQEVTIHASAENDLHRDLAARIHVVAPSLKITAEGPSFRYVGRKAHYVLTVTNDGGAPLNNIHVTHVVPESFRFVHADHGGEFDDVSRTVTWNIDHLDVQQSTPVKVELVSTQIGKGVHTVAAVAEQGARSEQKLETVVDGVASLAVEIVKQADPVEVGVETGYEIHVRNDGSKAAANVAVACDVPSVLDVVRTEGATSVAAETGGQLSFQPLPFLEPGKAAIYRVHVRARAEGSHRFAVRLTADSIKDPLTYTELTKFYKD